MPKHFEPSLDSTKHPIFEEVRQRAYKQLETLFYQEPKWDRFEADWPTLLPQALGYGSHQTEPGYVAPPDRRERINQTVKNGFHGYLSLFADERFLRHSNRHLMTPGTHIEADPDNTFREQLCASMQRSILNYREAARMHTHETYWELRKLGLPHRPACELLAALIKTTAQAHMDVMEDPHHIKGGRVPLSAVNAYEAPRHVHVIHGIHPKDGPLIHYKSAETLNRKTFPPIPAKERRDLNRLGREHFGFDIVTDIRSGIDY